MKAIPIGVVLVWTAKLVGPAAAHAQEFSGAEQEVWSMEETYWERVAAGDVAAYLDLWDEAFVGWPCTAEAPATKEAIGNWVAPVREGTYEISYDLVPYAVRVFGDIAVAYYTTPIIYRFANGGVDGENELWKFVHTWRRDGDTWRIIGGMCGLHEWGSAPWP
ncbi:MAG: nuclear transport factor 2 family protein [Gemmatimonadales bacterium]